MSWWLKGILKIFFIFIFCFFFSRILERVFCAKNVFWRKFKNLFFSSCLQSYTLNRRIYFVFILFFFCLNFPKFQSYHTKCFDFLRFVEDIKTIRFFSPKLLIMNWALLFGIFNEIIYFEDIIIVFFVCFIEVEGICLLLRCINEGGYMLHVWKKERNDENYGWSMETSFGI